MPVIPALEVKGRSIVQGQSGLQGAPNKTMEKLEGEGGVSRLSATGLA